jgi:hypothetical protein
MLHAFMLSLSVWLLLLSTAGSITYGSSTPKYPVVLIPGMYLEYL